MNKITMISVIGMLLLAVSAYADYSFHLDEPHTCDAIVGSWSGKGRATNWIVGTCKYNGIGIISSIDNAHHFSLHVNAKKDHGGYMCPAHAAEQLDFTCVNGLITIKTDSASMRGTMSSNKGSASGVINIAPGMEAKIALQFSR